MRRTATRGQVQKPVWGPEMGNPEAWRRSVSLRDAPGCSGMAQLAGQVGVSESIQLPVSNNLPFVAILSTPLCMILILRADLPASPILTKAYRFDRVSWPHLDPSRHIHRPSPTRARAFGGQGFACMSAQYGPFACGSWGGPREPQDRTVVRAGDQVGSQIATRTRSKHRCAGSYRGSRQIESAACNRKSKSCMPSVIRTE